MFHFVSLLSFIFIFYFLPRKSNEFYSWSEKLEREIFTRVEIASLNLNWNSDKRIIVKGAILVSADVRQSGGTLSSSRGMRRAPEHYEIMLICYQVS